MIDDIIDHLKNLSDRYQIPEGLIQIEITETISNMDHLVVNNIAKGLRSMGFAVSMDDFGTKYSNMAVLTQFEFDTVKIDRSLLLEVETNEKNKTILKYTLEMLRELGIESVMEGVETAEQLEILRELGCDTIQGYYFGRPEPMDKFYQLYM
jgi:EAL domain-containing protein (putative c-di-GMP-specific phosphodiesterase class I)